MSENTLKIGPKLAIDVVREAERLVSDLRVESIQADTAVRQAKLHAEVVGKKYSDAIDARANAYSELEKVLQPVSEGK